MNSISIVVPAFNEQSRIRPTLETICSFMDDSNRDYEIIVVNDGSTDDTLQAAEAIAASGKPLTVVDYAPNRGKGYAVRQGVMKAVKDSVLMTDADLAAPIDQLLKLEAALEEGFDVVVGSREAAGAVLPVEQPFYRRLGGRTLNLAIRALAVPGIRDTQCGFKLFRTGAARAIFEKATINDFGFDIEALYLARKTGQRIKEVGIRWSHQEGSTVRPIRDGLRVLRDIARIRMTHYKLNRTDG
jgi:dolichyl-phosphate beta-glucosyltransferase